MAYTLLHDRLSAYLMTVSGAAIAAGVEGPDADTATLLLDEYLTSGPQTREDREVAEWRVAVGLREAV